MKKENNPVSQEKFKTLIGGQALIEGIMMQGPDKRSIVVRGPEGLVKKVEPLKKRTGIAKWPLIRGVVNFASSMVSGVKALMYSAEFFPEDEADAQPSKFEQWLDRTFSNKKLEGLIVGLSVLLGIGLSIFLFLVLPTFLTGGLLHFFPDFPMWGRNLIEGVLKVAIFLLYLIFCSKQKDIYRVFQYHGAEHKCINCVEHGHPQTVKYVRESSKEHKRCGTSFILIVMVISILMFMVIRVDTIWMRILSRIILVPVIAGISYEVLQCAGRSNSKFMDLVSRPGMWMQGLTTKEPDDSMIEVASAATEAVFDWREYLTENFPGWEKQLEES